MSLREPADLFNVFMLTGAFQHRGSSARTTSLAQMLPSRGVRLNIVTTGTSFPPELNHAKIGRLSARYLSWPVLNVLGENYLYSVLKKQVPDLIDIQHRSLHRIGLKLAQNFRKPYILTIHDYLRDREKLVLDLQWCHRIIAVSESVRDEFQERTKVPSSLMTVIPSGVKCPPEKELSPLFSAGRSPVVGTAGPLEAGKGMQHFMRAAVRILKARPDVLFVIAGEGPEEKTLRRLALDLKISHAVTILPNLTDLSTALRAMDVFVLPSLKQGLGSTILNAMSWGLPVVACHSGGVKSLVLEGETGLLVAPSDDTALAEKVRELLDQPDKAIVLGKNGRSRIEEKFSVERMVDATMQIYKEITLGSTSTTLPAHSESKSPTKFN